MLPCRAEALCLDGLRTIFDMQRFQIEDIVFLARELGRLIMVLKEAESDEYREKDTLSRDVESLRSDIVTLTRLDLNLSIAHAERMIEKFEEETPTIRQYEAAAMYEELLNRLHDECKLRYTVLLNTNAKYLLDQSIPLFGRM